MRPTNAKRVWSTGHFSVECREDLCRLAPGGSEWTLAMDTGVRAAIPRRRLCRNRTGQVENSKQVSPGPRPAIAAVSDPCLTLLRFA